MSLQQSNIVSKRVRSFAEEDLGTKSDVNILSWSKPTYSSAVVTVPLRIGNRFSYYNEQFSIWQNSFRHNLSLNNYFFRIPHLTSEPPGKSSS